MSKTHKCTWILPDFLCPILSSRLDAFTSGHVTVQLHFLCLEISPSSPAWHDQAAWATVRKRWLLRKVILAPLMSTMWGRTWASQWMWCEHGAQHWWFTSFTIIGAGGNWGYNAGHVSAALMEELKYLAKGRKACFLGCWGFVNFKRQMKV